MEDYIIKGDAYSIFITNIQSVDVESNSIYLSKEEKEKLSIYFSDKRKIEFSSVRYLLKKYIGDYTIEYDGLGAPNIIDGPNISISHSHKYVAIAQSNKNRIGIDIEKIKEKIQKITTKFINLEDLKNITSEENELNETTYTKIWCCKEAIYKILSNKKIGLKEHITIKLSSPYTATAFVNFENTIHSFYINIHYLDDYIIAAVVK